MNRKKTGNKEVVGERVCKKCGEPLRSTNKNNYCDYCRRERAKTRRKAMDICLGIGAIGLSILPCIKHFRKK